MKEIPIYDFTSLKEFLSKKGINVGEVTAVYKPNKGMDVTFDDLGKSIHFSKEGIIYINKEGLPQTGFLYKKYYHFGYGTLPKFHLCKCTAINTFGEDEYMWANTEPVICYDKGNFRKPREVSDMALCAYCKNILLKNNTKVFNTIKDFALEMEERAKRQNVETDILGYTKDWEQISLAFREKHQYTCQECGIRIDAPFDRMYMHTHHINGIKTDNRESNLQCLCIGCHSKIDEIHRERWAKGANKIMLNDFTNRYQKKSEKNNLLYQSVPFFREDIEEENFESEIYYEYDTYTEEDTWDAMTDGMYGDYPGGNIDYDFLGY